jgi:hypothetical protein
VRRQPENRSKEQRYGGKRLSAEVDSLLTSFYEAEMMIESVHPGETSMEPIFNVFAQTVGWLEGGVAFGDDGHPVALIDHGSVFAAGSGRYLLGCIVASLGGSDPSAVRPTLRGTRRPPEVLSYATPCPVRHAAPPQPTKPLLNRSSLEWDRFVAGCEAKWPWETRL